MPVATEAWLEWTTTISAIVALLVAFLTLYLSLLRQADVEIDHLPNPEELPGGSTTGGVPTSHQATITLFASNVGVHAALLTEVFPDAFKCEGAEPAYWSGFGQVVVTDSPYPSRGPVDLPIVLGPGETKPLWLAARLASPLPTSYIEPPDLRPVAEQLRHLEGFSFDLSWTFIRTSGLPVRWAWLPRPFRWHRTAVRRSQRVKIDATSYRESYVIHWRQTPEFQELADIAEGKDSAAS